MAHDLLNFLQGISFEKKTSQQSVFAITACKISNEIAKLHKLLLENRKAYLNINNYLHNKVYLTDEDRNDIDNIAGYILKTCSEMIVGLKYQIRISDFKQQEKEHKENMVLMIEDYLKQVAKIFTEQKSIRKRKSEQLNESLKLQPLKPNIFSKVTTSTDVKAADSVKINENVHDSSSLKIQDINGDTSEPPHLKHEQLSSEDVQMFENENQQLYNELNAITDEINQIESKVVHITELQQMFTEKVLVQDATMESISTTVVGSTENVKEANEQIRQAIQRNANLRVWLLLFLLVMSFTLIFLDWYND